MTIAARVLLLVLFALALWGFRSAYISYVIVALFFVITVRQFNKFDRRTVLLSFLATLMMGLFVELIEGATGGGNCRMRDLVPDVAGALIAAAIVGVLVAARRRLTTFD